MTAIAGRCCAEKPTIIIGILHGVLDTKRPFQGCQQNKFRFQVQGYSILIRSETLANAIARLSNENRSIVLLSYFLDMTDQEIADKLDMVRRTVNYKHMRSLEKLREEMEVDSGGEQNK